MKVKELIEILQQFDGNLDVKYNYKSPFYWDILDIKFDIKVIKMHGISSLLEGEREVLQLYEEEDNE